MSNENAPPPKGKSAFEERYVLDTTKPLPEFDTPGGSAFLIVDREAPETRPLYGFVHNPMIPLRNDVYLQLKKFPAPNMVCPVDRGLVTANIGGQEVQRLVTAFMRPTGGALFVRGGAINPRVNAGSLRQGVILGALKALAALHKKNIVHRSLIADRIFFAEPNSDEIMIGECVSTPPGYQNPMSIEPLDSAFVDDRARGEMDSMADFYHLGAALQSAYFAKKLWIGRDTASLLISRVNQGSFWTIGGGQDVPGALGTLIKGLMADEVGERWSTEDILDWFEGLAKPKRTVLRSYSMNRPTTFKGVAYVDRRLLAHAFARDPRDAASFLRKIDFASWVQISMRDEVLSERLENVINVSRKTTYAQPSALDDHRMVSRVCMFLHPSGSIRYKGFTFDLDGIPTLLAYAFAHDNRDLITAIVEILDNKFINALEEICAEHLPSFSQKVSRIKPVMEYVGGSKTLGGGMERVLYELNPSLPCMSQRFDRVWIVTIRQIMAALDRIAERGGGKNVLVDRHVSGFIAARGTGLDRAFNKLAAVQHEPSRFASLSADFFAGLQRMAKLPSLPHLTTRIVESLGPAVRGLKNKKRREKVLTVLEKVKKGGDISKLTSEINLTKIQVQDQREFSQARTAVMKIERERSRLTKKVSPNDTAAMAYGYRGARVIAFLVFASTLMLNLAA